MNGDLGAAQVLMVVLRGLPALAASDSGIRKQEGRESQGMSLVGGGTAWPCLLQPMACVSSVLSVDTGDRAVCGLLCSGQESCLEGAM